MPTFIFSYRSPQGYRPTPDSAAAWMAWFDEMGDHVVDVGKPVVGPAAVGNCSPEATELGGYSLVSAEDLEAAKILVKGCPTLQRDGGVEIGLLGEVPSSA